MKDVHDEHIRKALWVLLAIVFMIMATQTFPNILFSAILSVWLMAQATSSYRRRHIRMLWRDLRTLRVLSAYDKCIANEKKNQKTIPLLFNEVAKRLPYKTAIYHENDEWTYQKIDEYSNRIGNYFANHGVHEGDTVALFMETRTEYVPIWLGLLKIGASVALINNNLTDKSLLHCLRIVNSNWIIYGSEVEEAINAIFDELELPSTKLHVFRSNINDKPSVTKSVKAKDLRTGVEIASNVTPPPPIKATPSSIALYIFTSGTTGMPKAVKFSHIRIFATAIGGYFFGGIQESDKLYVSLPLYHTNGGIIGVGQALFNGVPVVLRKKFSATHFWEDCIRYNCTVFIYIGEICRYLLASPSKPEDKQHSIRFIIGNGLRQKIWEPFMERFNIKNVFEFYGSSEGIGSLLNSENKVGAVGYLPWLWSKVLPLTFVEIDPEKEMPRRDSKGRCIQVTKPGVLGMHICKVDETNVFTKFEGYTDSTSTSKKIIHDVFTEGDTYYVSGDAFVLDEEKFVYFQDRLGDTFRWKGENVATTEVEQVISDIISLSDAVVYGVPIPGVEGKAGMAAILDKGNKVNLDELNKELSRRLPKFAKPLFIRLSTNIELTETYKLKKFKLKAEGFDPALVKDKLYYFNGQKYLLLDLNVYQKIINGELKF